MHHAIPLAGLLLCASATAQITTPPGLLTTEGNAVFAHWTGSRRFQQVEASQIGSPMVINSISWRRNGNQTQTAAGARTFDMTVDLGLADFGFLSQRLDDNFLGGTRTTVFNQTGVNFPDWNANLGAPAPFDFTIALTTPYAYVGTNALVIDFSFANIVGATGSVSTDRDFNGYTTPPAGTALGTGCIATGRTVAFGHTAYLSNLGTTPSPNYGMRLRVGGTNAPASAPVIVMIDAQNQGIPGLCTTLYALPLLSIVRTALSTGAVPDIDIGFTHDASLQGAVFFSQLLALDAGQSPIPAVLSNGRQTTMAASPGFTNGHRCSYAWHTLPATATTVATVFVGGGLVMQLQ